MIQHKNLECEQLTVRQSIFTEPGAFVGFHKTCSTHIVHATNTEGERTGITQIITHRFANTGTFRTFRHLNAKRENHYVQIKSLDIENKEQGHCIAHMHTRSSIRLSFGLKTELPITSMARTVDELQAYTKANFVDPAILRVMRYKIYCTMHCLSVSNSLSSVMTK